MFKYIQDLKEVVERQDTKIGILIDEVRHLQSLLVSKTCTAEKTTTEALPTFRSTLNGLDKGIPPPHAFTIGHTPTGDASNLMPKMKMTYANAARKNASKKAGNIKAAVSLPLQTQPQQAEEAAAKPRVKEAQHKTRKTPFGSGSDVVVLNSVIDLTQEEEVVDLTVDKLAAEFEPRPKKTIEPVKLLVSKVPPPRQFSYKKWREVIAQDPAIPKTDVLSMRRQQDHKMVVVVDRKSALAVTKQLRTVNRYVEVMSVPEGHHPTAEERKWWITWLQEERHRSTRQMIEADINRLAPDG